MKLTFRSVAICEHIRNSTANGLYANGGSKVPLSIRGSGIAILILRIEILNFEKIIFWPRIYEDSFGDHWQFRAM